MLLRRVPPTLKGFYLNDECWLDTTKNSIDCAYGKIEFAFSARKPTEASFIVNLRQRTSIFQKPIIEIGCHICFQQGKELPPIEGITKVLQRFLKQVESGLRVQ